jgi:electron transfer flavoprotein beta subunit
MAIVVAVKHAALDAGSLISASSDEASEPATRGLGETDLSAVALACHLGFSQNVEVVAITAGEPEADSCLRECLARGASRAVRVEVSQSMADDPLTAARALSVAIGREQAEAILCGSQSPDGASGATGGALAAYLGIPRIPWTIDARFEPGFVEGTREIKPGLLAYTKVRSPVLLTVHDVKVGPAQGPTLRAIKAAEQRDIQVLEPEQLGLGGEAAVTRTRFLQLLPQSDSPVAELIDTSVESAADRINELVQERSL